MSVENYREVKPKEEDVMTALDWKKLREEILRRKLAAKTPGGGQDESQREDPAIL